MYELDEVNLRGVRSQLYKSFDKDLDSKKYMDSHLLINGDIPSKDGLKGLNGSHKDHRSSRKTINFSLSYDIYNHKVYK